MSALTRAGLGRGRSRGWRACLRSAAGFAIAFGIAASVTAHVRLRYSANGTPLRWSSPESISIVVNSDGSDDVANGSHETAIESAVEAWNNVPGSEARIVINRSASAEQRVDWQSNDIHLVVFDETGSSGYFSGASGIVAITPVSFFTDGRIIDADVVFNGKNFRFTTSGENGAFDIQDVAAHELGHLIGLDHSGVCGATMYPYVDPEVILHRSLAIDDENGLRHIYPTSTFGRIQGRIVRDNGSGIAGAHVVGLDADGRVAAAILAGSDGSFTLEGLRSGSYTLYADPLDQPVSSANLGGGLVIETDFSTTSIGSVNLAGGATESVGTRTANADVGVSLGRVSDDYPIRIIQGATVTRSVRGSGLSVGSTLTASDPTIGINNVAFDGASVTFDVTVPAGSPTGHVDLTVETLAGSRDTLVGGLEVTPPDPLVLAADPVVGSPDGGTEVLITGEDFRSGARVVIGNRIYRDGASGGCVVEDDQTIRLTTRDTIAGEHDIVVIDPSGVEGRFVDSFVVDVAPQVNSTFPSVGSSIGGTTITVSGTDLTPDLLVEIDGVLQSDVFVESPTRMRVVTSGGVPGGPYVMRFTTPGGLITESAFTYVDTPDPRITLVTPDEADRSGGRDITVYGSGFTESTRVVFGANPSTGNGGVTGATEFLTAGTLSVTVPQSTVGTTSIMARDRDTGQAMAISAGFTYTGEQPVDTGDSGGCAAVIPPLGSGGGGPPTWRAVMGGAGWIVLLLMCAFLQGQRALRSSSSLG